MNVSKKTLLSVALTSALGLTSISAMSATILPDFQVDPDMATPTTFFTADKITGNYTEQVNFGAGTFTSSILWNPSSFAKNDGNTSILAGASKLGVDYQLYGLFTGSGTFSVSGSGTEFLFTSSTFQLWYDDLTDSSITDFTAPGDGSTTNFYTANTNGGTDLMLGSGILTGPVNTSSNGGTLAPGSGANGGSFGVTDTFTLTNEGLLFFIEPRPFYNITLGSGQFNALTPTAGQFQEINGSADFYFTTVPEPASLALIGIGLMGLSMGRRKQA